MRSLIFILLVALVASTAAYYKTKEFKVADKDFLVKQKQFFDVFRYIFNPEIQNDYYKVAQEYKIDTHADKYTNKDAVKDFMFFYRKGFLGVHDIYYQLHKEHKMQMMAVFKMFYYAADFETFFNTFVWARFHINPLMFIDAVHMAVFHRDDLAGFVLPAMYEINPYMYFKNYVIKDFQDVGLQGENSWQKVDDYFYFNRAYNYSTYYDNTYYFNDAGKLAYFTEDIGLNQYYYYYNMDYNTFLGGKEFGLYKDRRGEFYLYQLRQFLARYYLERLSNGFGVIPDFTFNTPVMYGYNPSLMFYNGVNFPTRDNYYMMYLNKNNYNYIEKIQNYEHRIYEAIDLGYFIKENGEQVDLRKPENVEYLGNLIQKNVDSMGSLYYYGYLEIMYKKILGGTYNYNFNSYDNYNYNYYNYVPSVLEVYQTAMRDPMFYMMYKRILAIYDQYVYTLPKYTYDDLYFPGVKVTGVEMDKLVTYFDMFDADITNVLQTDVTGKYFDKYDRYFKVSVPRLNFVPFNFKLKVNSEAAQKAVVYMYVGPKYDVYGNVIDLNANRENFWQLDHFTVDLTAGENVITRSSNDFTWFVNDRTTFFDIYKYVMLGIEGKQEFHLDMSEAHCGFPRRLMLPRGRVGGFDVQFFFMVYKYNQPNVELFTGYDEKITCGVGSGARYVDTNPFGFPFNRQLEEYSFIQPNMYFYGSSIYFKNNY